MSHNIQQVFQSYWSKDGRDWQRGESSDSFPYLMRAALERSTRLQRFEKILNLEIGEMLVCFHRGSDWRVPGRRAV